MWKNEYHTLGLGAIAGLGVLAYNKIEFLQDAVSSANGGDMEKRQRRTLFMICHDMWNVDINGDF